VATYTFCPSLLWETKEGKTAMIRAGGLHLFSVSPPNFLPRENSDDKSWLLVLVHLFLFDLVFIFERGQRTNTKNSPGTQTPNPSSPSCHLLTQLGGGMPGKL